MTRSAKGIALLALLAAVISFAKFQPCRASGWVAPDVYIKMCYSDLSALYGAREINVDKWPYSSPDNSVEYPVITGLVMWATGLLISDPNGYRGYFDINTFLLALLFIASALALWRIRPEFAYLLPAAPAVVVSLYINWDLWAIAGALAAIYFFQQERYSLSALALGVAIATKFFPIVLLLGVLLHFLHRRDLRALINYFAITGGSWLAINLPFALTNFAGWFRFYKLNLERGPDLGSLWYGIELLGRSSANSNFAAIILLALGILGIVYTFNRSDGRLSEFDNFALSAFLAVALFVTVSKVYSPQYIIWLTPLALIALRDRTQRSAFWIWQGGEAIYQIAIWQYLASYTGAKFGLPQDFYALSIFLRVATLAWFVATLVKGALPEVKPNPQPAPALISR